MNPRCSHCKGEKIATYQGICRTCGGTGIKATTVLEREPEVQMTLAEAVVE